MVTRQRKHGTDATAAGLIALTSAPRVSRSMDLSCVAPSTSEALGGGGATLSYTHSRKKVTTVQGYAILAPNSMQARRVLPTTGMPHHPTAAFSRAGFNRFPNTRARLT